MGSRPRIKSFLRWNGGIETRTYIACCREERHSTLAIMESAFFSFIRFGLEWPCPRQVLKKLVSPVAPSMAARASRWKSSYVVPDSGLCSRWHSCSRAISDQTMRAFLLATATQALEVPSRCCLSLIQRLRLSVFAFAR